MILLDTHIWIWLSSRPELIPQKIHRTISAQNAVLALSTISIWEVLMSAEKGRIKIQGDPERAVRRWVEANPVEIVPVDLDVAILSRTLAFAHQDPADRFIAATSLSRNASLATVDPNLIRLSWLKTLPV